MPINRKVPIRKCIATGEMLPKKEMIRVVRTKEGEVEVDLTGKKSGRGAYVSKSEAAIQTAKERNVFERQLEVKVPDQIYDDLLAIVRKELKA
ncbi:MULTISPECIES: RNase P modulator RnpM [Rummeliibacillus]|uniref:RNase P modulator RnpM n=1 Tax=Rummeliibacillus TaxID=648802 RepID=UPI0011B5C627|nr:MULTISPECIES: YlxR family protein [Rummeliibacillus]